MERFAKKICIVFVLLQTFLYVAFLTLDLSGKNSSVSSFIKFTIIILCFCYALLSLKSANKSILFYIRAGLLFTVISDLFLLILDLYFYGVLTFILVQQFYAIRIDISVDVNKKDKRFTLLCGLMTRLFLQVGITFIICFILNRTGVILEGVLIASVFYFICILTNTIRAVYKVITKEKDTSLILFAFGMVLFLLCDINVGLYNLSGFISLPKEINHIIYNFSSILMWTFYAPSQVLIALSSHENR